MSSADVPIDRSQAPAAFISWGGAVALVTTSPVADG